jgi:CheY-like chemotaxis protein
LRVLVIDDEPLVRVVLDRTLRQDGHEPHLAASGTEGIDAFVEAINRNEPFDLVVTDLVMPFVDGRQVARAVRQRSPDVPIVLLTGWGARFGTDDREPVSALVDLVLTKPPSLRALRAAIEQIFGGSASS